MNKSYVDPYNFKDIIQNELNATNPFTFKGYFGYKQNVSGQYTRDVNGDKIDNSISDILQTKDKTSLFTGNIKKSIKLDNDNILIIWNNNSDDER